MKSQRSPRLPAPAAGCRVTVCIPARDEAEFIGSTLEALCAQRGIDGRALGPDCFDVVVFANDCSDETAAIARSVARRVRQPRIFVVEQRTGGAQAHVGSARKHILDLAAERFRAAGLPDGVIVSLDADTLPAADWLAWITREMNGHDAVAGRVTIAQADQERLLAPVRLLYARELTYRQTLAEAEAWIDPRPGDPLPRHGSFVGASFAVSAACYFAAGGLPPRRRLEDVDFARALHRIDARIRYSPQVRAATSARLAARVEGGFGTFMGELHDCARRGVSFTVEHPAHTLADLEVRAAMRRLRGASNTGDIERVGELLCLTARCWLPLMDPAVPLGAVCERILARAKRQRPQYPPAPVEAAIDALRAAVAAARPAQPSKTGTFGSLDAG